MTLTDDLGAHLPVAEAPKRHGWLDGLTDVEVLALADTIDAAGWIPDLHLRAQAIKDALRRLAA